VQETDEIVLSGNLEYDSNVTGSVVLLRAHLALQRERWPLLKWRIVGRNQENPERRLAGDDRIRFMAVDDTHGACVRARQLHP
jgi:hypothetical protein